MSSECQLSLIIPCYNEEKNLPLLADKCLELLKSYPCEVILVDNGSSDQSAIVLKKLTELHPNLKSCHVPINKGYGFGILSGLREARGEYLAWTHADLQTNPLDALKATTFFNNHQKVFIKGRRYGRPVSDVFFTFGMSIFESLFLGVRLWDINAQPTVFHKSFFQTWTEPPHDFSLDLYAYYHARKQGLQVKRFPVYFGQRAHGVSHWNVNWAAKFKFIRRTLEFSIKLKRNLKA